MQYAGIEPAVPASEPQQTDALDRAATEISPYFHLINCQFLKRWTQGSIYRY